VILHRFLKAISTPAAMIAAGFLLTYLILASETWRDVADAVVGGISLLFAQGIYRTGEPRDIALHKKLDSLLDGTDGDSNLKGIEEK